MVRREALNWLEEALMDLKRADRALEWKDYALSTFMSQQACEKALKAAYLALAKKMYPKTHDLTMLYEGVRELLRFSSDLVEKLPEVSQYYVMARYPNAALEIPSKSISRSQAERALNTAKKLVKLIEERIRGVGDP